MENKRRSLVLGLLLIGWTGGVSVFAGEPIPHRYVDLMVDSGEVWNADSVRSSIFEEVVRVPDVPWIRLFFSRADLGSVDGRADGSILRLTSLEDGAVQILTAESLAQWQQSSAFFNGDAVRVELVADPESEPSRVAIHEVMVGEPAAVPESICGPTDDRVLSFDDRAARVVPVGCTVWLIDDAEGCFLTAGHCAGASLSVIEFNVPLSDPNGSVNHPGPEDQYPVDTSSVQFTNGGIGNDWGYFGAFPNSQTLLTPLEAQGMTFVMGTPPAAGATIRITGYGTTTGTQGTPLDWSQVQTTHTGPLVNATSTTLQYAVDTTGGDSGSPVIHEATGNAVGIHTHAGCSEGGGANNGSNILIAGLQNALANPIGICADGAPPLKVSLEGAIADPLPVAGSSFQVSVVDRDGIPAAINSATLVYDAGGGDLTAPLADQGGGLWEATLPAADCGTEITFRVDVEATNGTVVSHPYSHDAGADRRYRRFAAASHAAAFYDPFETDLGWTVDSDGSLSAGEWERGLPSGYGLRGDAPWDADTIGEGRAFFTDPAGGNTDVDGGATRLVSPPMDGTIGADPHLSYWRWWDDAGASDDTFLVELSNDDGGSWVTLEQIGPGVIGSWVRQTYRVADFLPPTSELRVRFTAGDLGAGNIIEAAVDGVVLRDDGFGFGCSEIFADGFESGDTSAWSTTVP